MFKTTLAALTVALTFSSSAAAERSLFFEETASAFWAVPHECADGSTVQGTLLVQSTRDFEAPDTEDPDPTVRVQFLAVLSERQLVQLGGADRPGDDHELREPQERHRGWIGSSHGQPRWDAPGLLRRHVDGRWTLETAVNGPGSKRQQREATAAGQVIFDGEVLVDGAANHPTRPAPFIRVDTEK